jgi:urease accessory protein
MEVEMTGRRRLALVAAMSTVLALVPTVALAHEDQVIRLGSFWGGFLHPVLGLDHFLAMVAVGIVSAQIGGRAVWSVPAAFVGTMGVGYLLGRADLGIGDAVEWPIVGSVIILGAVIATGGRIHLAVAFGAVAFFAAFHGYAHGAEIPAIADPPRYALGFSSGTAVIHLLGVLIGSVARRYRFGPVVLRTAGGVVSSIGVLFAAGVL